MQTTMLAIDLGASSGRVVAGTWDGARLQLDEVHRFANTPVVAHTALYWDILRLWHEIQAGMQQATVRGHQPQSIGVDSWAVDYALVDSAGDMLANPYHYRDERTAGLMAQISERLGRDALFARTGLQFLPFNTIYQLAAAMRDQPALLAQASALLMIPDLLHFWLSGRQVGEYTNASTTQLLDAGTRTWSAELITALGLPQKIFPELVQPGTIVGPLRPQLAAEMGLFDGVQVIAPATHDTASAVAAIPGLDTESAYISSGTWSLVGLEIDQPIATPQALELNLTNEGGVAGSIRLLRNVAGLWLIQACQQVWQHQYKSYDVVELLAQAAAEPRFVTIIDPDAAVFLAPSDMPAAIRDFCQATGQPVPQSNGAIVRCCLDSLALRYRWVIEALETVSGRTLTTIRVVGGGSQNTLLCQLTADVCQRPVVAGPVEATALGNIAMQAIALGLIADVATARQVIADSIATQRYTPQAVPDLESAWQRFLSII